MTQVYVLISSLHLKLWYTRIQMCSMATTIYVLFYSEYVFDMLPLGYRYCYN